MSSQQSTLRQLMKLERQKNNALSKDGDNMNSLTTSLSAAAATAATKTTTTNKVKGILKSKSSYSQPDSSREDMKRDESVPFVKFDGNNNKRVSVVTTTENTNEDEEEKNDNVMKEFEDFLDSVDDEGIDNHTEESKSEASSDINKPTTTAEQFPIHEGTDFAENVIYDAADDDNINQRNKDEEQLEQIAYEARLAKLMLLSRKRKLKSIDDTIIDFTPQLAFQESSSAYDETKIQSIHASPSPKTNNYASNSNQTDSELHTKNSLKNILKQKRRRKSNSHKGNGDDDSYWS